MNRDIVEEKIIKFKKVLLIILIGLVVSTIIIMFINSKISPYFIGASLIVAFIYEFLVTLLEEHAKNKRKNK
jgi:uncharacterized membrane protein